MLTLIFFINTDNTDIQYVTAFFELFEIFF